LGIIKFLKSDPHNELSDLEVRKEITTLLITFIIAFFAGLFTSFSGTMIIGIITYCFFRYMQRPWSD